MVVDVNLEQIGNYIGQLNKLIDEFEEAELNVFNQLKDSCVNWSDANSLVFSEQISDEKKSTNLFLIALQDNVKLFDYICDEYRSIGTKIRFNLAKKDSIISAIDDSIMKATSAISALNSINSSFNYSALGSIQSQRSAIESAKRTLQNMREKVTTLYNRIKNIEDNVASRIMKIEEIKMTNFRYDFNRS